MPPTPATPRKMPFERYSPQVPLVLEDRTWPNVIIDRAPTWCEALVELLKGFQKVSLIHLRYRNFDPEEFSSRRQVA